MSTWSPTDNGSSGGSSLVLSGGDLIATCDASVVFAGVRGTTSHSSGKRYIEFQIVGMANGGASIGIANATVGFGSHSDQNNVVGLYGSGGNFVIPASGSMGAAVAAQTMRLALDFDTGFYWIAYGAGDWNADGSADPVAEVNGKVMNGAGGYSSYGVCPLTPGGTPVEMFPWAFFDFASGTVTLVPSSFAYTVPTGYTGWDATVTNDGVWNSTEATDVFAATGHQTVVGVLATTEAHDVFSAYGHQPLSGVLAATEAPDIFNAIGIGQGENGIFVTTEAPDTFSAYGLVPVFGTLSVTEAADSFHALGAGVIQVRHRRIFTVT